MLNSQKTCEINMQISLLLHFSAVKLLHGDVSSPQSPPETSRALSSFKLLLNSFEGLRLP